MMYLVRQRILKCLGALGVSVYISIDYIILCVCVYNPYIQKFFYGKEVSAFIHGYGLRVFDAPEIVVKTCGYACFIGKIYAFIYFSLTL